MKSKIIAFAAILALVGVGIYVRGSGGDDSFYPPAASSPTPTPELKLGASGPNSEFPSFTFNGVTHHYRRAGFIASTTPCAIQAPNATTTLLVFNVQSTQSTSTQTIWSLATSTTAYATTTLIVNQKTIPSSAYGYFDLGTATTSRVIAPNSYVVLGVNPNTGGHNPVSIAGSCIAEFVQMN